MFLEVLTPEKTVFSGNVNSVSLPGTKSPFTVLKNHAPIISTLDKGDLSFITTQGVEYLYFIGEGMVEVNENKVMVLIENITPAEL